MASADSLASLTNAKTGTGVTADFVTAKRNVSVVMLPSGDITGGTVAVEVSHDGTNWVQALVMHIALRPGNHSHDFSHGAYRYWRATVLADITGGGSVTATFMEAG